MAPPLTFTFSKPIPRSLADCAATEAKASLISIRSRSSTPMPSLDSACLIAFEGCDWSELSGPATLPCAPISASHSRPSSSALALLITTTAAAPSEICEEDPAVIVPSLVNAGRSLASVSVVVSARMPSSLPKTTGSPLRCGISTGTISASNRPFFCAAAARWCEAAEISSCSARVRPSLALCRSVDSPIGMFSKASVSPS